MTLPPVNAAPDFSGEGKKEASKTDMLVIKEALARLAMLEAQLEEKEAEAGRIKAQIKRVSESEIPEIFDTIGIYDMTLDDGRKITIKSDVQCHIPPENQEQVFVWLREHEFGSLIKNEVKVAFGMNEDAEAATLIERLALEGLHVDAKTSIHPRTLTSFVREQQQAGNTLPDGIVVFPYRKTIVKARK